MSSFAPLAGALADAGVRYVMIGVSGANFHAHRAGIVFTTLDRDLFLGDLGSPCSQGSQAANANQNGVVFFPGAVPLYRNGEVVGGLGISGDGVEQDDYVSKLGAGEFLPAGPIWSDRILIRGVRMPFLKYPRQPTGVTETSLEPFDEQ